MDLEAACHSLERKCHAATEAREESRAQVSKLELRRHESEERVTQEEKRRLAADASLATSEAQNRELSKKVSHLFGLNSIYMYVSILINYVFPPAAKRP